VNLGIQAFQEGMENSQPTMRLALRLATVPQLAGFTRRGWRAITSVKGGSLNFGGLESGIWVQITACQFHHAFTNAEN
jgi:hypothetical protein